MIFPLPLLPSVSNMEEPGHGELRCAGEADGEEGREITLPPGSALAVSYCAQFPTHSLSSGPRGKCAGNRMNGF